MINEQTNNMEELKSSIGMSEIEEIKIQIQQKLKDEPNMLKLFDILTQKIHNSNKEKLEDIISMLEWR